MIKPNWDIFKAKFSENHQINFEWLCYTLFCQEFNKPVGIFRYKNQSGIETNPIIKDGEKIGWQSKFYENTLSDHKKDLIEMIIKSKRDYPELTRIIFYTNQEWGQGKSEPDSKVKKDVEQKGNESGIGIEWRTASFFESLFVTIENETIAKHFFSLGKSVFDLLEEKRRHTVNVLYDIQTHIDFKSKKIEIDRTEFLRKLRQDLNQNQILIISGAGGVGKTAVIKNLYEEIAKNVPLYVFKASEFNANDINDLFKDYALQAFIETHAGEQNKIIVIDSAEKLLDLNNTDPFKEFLSSLIKSNWKIIFTTRNNFLEDLTYQFIEIYRITPCNLNIQNLDLKELSEISKAYNFILPGDNKLLELIKNPFYLSEYLRFYTGEEDIDYVNFKEKLWNKIIVKSKPAREYCFLKIAFQRANEGQFFITPSCDSQILNRLVQDGILGYETAGYFITHDIYEEWALEKKIASEYIKKENNKDFFDQIRGSLPIRRSFRNWVSEKLLLKDESIINFIEEIIQEEEIDSFWKDDILISVLLSDYSASFFELFKGELLNNDQALLKRLTFLLRLACKEVDNDFLKQMGIKDSNLLSIEYVLTKPKGLGWRSTIRFIYDNLDGIGIKNINFVLPVIHDWNNKFKEGETTRLSSLIALKYYQWIIKEDVYFPRDDTKEHLFQTILYGSAEIRTELDAILQEVLNNKWNNHRDPYYDLVKVIITKFDGMPVWKILPETVLKVVDLFWFHLPVKGDDYFDEIGLERHFCIEEHHHDYFPSSPYQTPIYWLLQFSLQQTVDFVLAFTNKTVDCFAKSRFATNDVKEVEVVFEGAAPIKQYISDILWNMYRGTQASTPLLESLYMALEKFFLDRGKSADSKTLESWLLYLLKNSKSASISAVVTSIVLAYPEKTFNVARVLFQTKQFFLYDTTRLTLDQQQKSSLLGLKNMFGVSDYKNKIHEDERIKACDDEHRKKSLEQLALTYQVFRGEETSEEEAKKRQEVIWGIFDKYYSELPGTSEETDSDKTWRLFLARMDRRKMKIKTEKKKDGVFFNFNPEIEPELKEYSEESLKKSSAPMKHASLKLWASYKKNNDERYKQYKEYEDSPQLTLKEVKEIIDKLKQGEEESFRLFNQSIPGDVCSILVRNYFEQLSKEEREYCKDVILNYARLPLEPNYRYQILDGTESAISALPSLLQNYPEEREDIILILLLTLFNDYPINMAGGRYNVFSIMAIHKLWENSFDDAQSLLLGYLLLKPTYEKMRKKLRKESYEKGVHELQEGQLRESFFKEYEPDLEKVLKNTISMDELKDTEQTDLYILNTAFQLIPLKTDLAGHKELVLSIVSSFTNKILSREREDKVDYSVRHAFLEKLAYFVLSSSQQDIPDYLKSFMDNFNGSEAIAELFEEFILAEDRLDTYEKFWQVWMLFFEKVVALCNTGNEYWYVDRIIKSYLFAKTPWKETTTDWHTLKDSDSKFFGDIAKNIGHCPSVVYSLVKSLNDVASKYLNYGISWLSGMLTRNKKLWTAKLETNTLYYLEKLARKYIYKERDKIRRIKKLKEEVLVILDFLVKRGSVIGYILRENIL